MRTHLLDANVLIALSFGEHEHHEAALRWFGQEPGSFATSPIVEGALARFVLRIGESPATLTGLLDHWRSHPRCVFWPDDVPYAEVDLADVSGHRQVTDVYLVSLAVAHGGRLATLDRALVGLRPNGTTLVT
ncbi:hypothetical protein BCF74_10560 [Knoellia remsis]|uniref:Ribonuclease VapC n=1 Tax=Knoellia remsis TaxID=407159 RepID=A0A2T0UUB5_9MICO|nr:TA system VapC family ribonuclease toxin [Knoellia remsis]PRY61503.1 hypothetical protein BCF74_10560 [Knoellia remsis]